MSKQSDLVNITQGDTITVDHATGRVGIGTNSPSHGLDVYSVSGNVARVTNGSSGGTPSTTHGEFVVESGDANMGIQLLGTATSNQRILFGDPDSVGPGQLVYDHTSNYMSFFANASERMRIDSSGNVGIGVVPSAWANFKGIQVQQGSLVSNQFSAGNLQTIVGSNVFYNGAYKYITSDFASYYNQVGGNHIWYTAPSGAAGATATVTERMRIDSVGRVTMPYQPSFRAHSFVPISASTGIIVWQTTAHNVGNHYNTSNGAFTAPVNGTYHFAGNILMSANSSTSYIRVLFRINGAASTTLTDSLTGGVAGAFTNYSYHAIQIAQSFYLYEGDTVQMSNDSPNSSTWSEGGYGSFSGFLVG